MAHDIYRKDKSVVAHVRRSFPGVVNLKGEVNRTRLGEIIFNDRAKRHQLDSIVHPAVFKEMLRQIWSLKVTSGKKLIVLDVPLLFETKFLSWMCYPILCVYVKDQTLQIDRLMARSEMTK